MSLIRLTLLMYDFSYGYATFAMLRLLLLITPLLFAEAFLATIRYHYCHYALIFDVDTYAIFRHTPHTPMLMRCCLPPVIDVTLTPRHAIFRYAALFAMPPIRAGFSPRAAATFALLL